MRRNVAYVKSVWVDVHVFDGADAFIHAAQTFALRYLEGGRRRRLFPSTTNKIYQGSGGGSGMGRTDVAGMCAKSSSDCINRVNSEAFTNGLSHQHEVPADVSIQ